MPSQPPYRLYHSFRLVLLSCLFCGFANLPSSYAQQVTLERLWSGLKSASGVTDIAVKGDAGYVASSRGLEVYDLRSSPRLRLSSTHELIPQNDLRLRVADDTLLLAWNADTGLSFYSISEPLQPRFLKHLALLDVYDVDVAGEQLFAAWREPRFPVVLQYDWVEAEASSEGRIVLHSMNGFQKVMVSGGHVYALGFGFDNDELHIGRLKEGGYAERFGFISPSYLFIVDVAVQDSVVLLLREWDDRDAAQHVDILRWDETGALRLAKWKYQLESSYVMNSMLVSDSLLLFYGERNLLPGQVKRTLLSGRIVGDTAVVFLDTLPSGLVRDQVGTYPLTLRIFPIGLEERMYAVSGERLLWRDRVGIYSGQMESGGELRRGADALLGELSYDVSGMDRDRVFTVASDRLYGIDFTDPQNPAFLSSTPMRAEGVAMVNRERLIAFDSVVRLFDVSNPASPFILDSLNLGEGRIAWRAEVSDSVIVLCCLEEGTVVLVLRGDKLYQACEISAKSSDGLWTEMGLFLTTLDTTEGEWQEFPVVDSEAEWCSPERLKVWGITGQALTQNEDTVYLGTGRRIEVYNILSLTSKPELLHTTTDVRLGGVTGLEYHNGLLFVEGIDFAMFMFRFDKDLDLKRLGWWELDWQGDQRFYVTDSLLICAEGHHGLQSFGFHISTLSVLESQDVDMETSLELWPNVVVEQATMQLQLPSAQSISLSLYNSSGRVEHKVVAGEFEAGEHLIEIETTGLPAGIYWLVLKNHSGEQTLQQFQVIR